MASPARRHLHRITASRMTGSPLHPGRVASPDEQGEAAREYRLLLIALGEDLRRLHDIQSVERKIDAKREMIGHYRDWVDGALMTATPVQDEIVATMLVWAIDIADWPLALELAGHVLRNGLALPERYRRTPATLIAEQVAEAGLAPEPAVDLATLQQVDDLTEPFDMPDEVRAKLKKAIGLAFAARVEAFDPAAADAVAGGRAALIAAALDHLTRALELDSRCGVKKSIEQLQRAAKKPPEGPQA